MKKPPNIEPHQYLIDSCPERRLWAAVIATVVTDAEIGLKALKRGVDKGLDIRNANYKLDEAIYIMKQPWFETICGFLDMHPDWVKKLIEKKANDLGLTLEGLKE